MTELDISDPLAFVVDDEPDMLDIITFALETQGFRTERFLSAEAAWIAAQRVDPDLFVLDVTLPGASGISLCHRIRTRSDTPVILVTARGESSDRIVGLEAEADDYLTKPFHPRELALRAARLVRRKHPNEIRMGAVRLDLAAQDASIDGVRLILTINEFRILTALIQRSGEVVEYADLLAAAWGESRRPGDRETMRAAIYRLRGKLDAISPGSGAMVESIRGRGYLFRQR